MDGRPRFQQTFGTSAATRAFALAALPDLDGDGQGEWAGTLPDETPEAGTRFQFSKAAPPLAPAPTITALTASTTIAGAFRIEWTSSLGAGTSFVVENRSPQGQWAESSPMTDRFLEQKVGSGHAYEFRVRAIGAGGSDWSAPRWVNLPKL